MATLETEHQTIYQKVREILFRYRATPLANDQTPPEKFYHRRFRIKLDAFETHKI